MECTHCKPVCDPCRREDQMPEQDRQIKCHSPERNARPLAHLCEAGCVAQGHTCGDTHCCDLNHACQCPGRVVPHATGCCPCGHCPHGQCGHNVLYSCPNHACYDATCNACTGASVSCVQGGCCSAPLPCNYCNTSCVRPTCMTTHIQAPCCQGPC